MFRNVVKEQLKVPANIDYLGELRDFVTRVGKRYGFTERVINAFKLSIDEAATNIIKHAYRDWSGDITIRAIIKRNTLTIVLIDQGKYFDPRQVSEPDLQRYVDIGKKGGLGIFIMRRLLDQIDYRKTEEGNELWMVKYREEPKKRKISVSSIPVSLKARYWIISVAIFTLAMIAAYLFFFVRQDNLVLSDYLQRGKSASSVLARDVANRLKDLDPVITEQLATVGSSDIQFVVAANEAINTISTSQHREVMHNALIVDVSGEIKALANDKYLKQFDKFEQPENARVLEEGTAVVYLTADQTRVLDVVQPVTGSDGRLYCNAHFLIDYSIISKEIKNARLALFNLALLVWVIGVASLFLLIYLVMNPFRRLQEWVKAMGQPGVVEEMDIDETTEVGEIAKAFSDITHKLRISQENLAEQERLQKEMQVAQEIQQTLLPSEFPEIDGYELASYYAAAKEVGGDYFDFVEVDKDTLGIVVGDVSGKGVPGSLVMTMIRTALRTEARGLKDAAQVLAKVNDFVINDIKKGMFVTLFYVIIDSRRRRLNYASAGHNPMILYRSSTNKTYYLNPRGFPIGISLPDKDLFRKSIESDTIALAEDDILLVYTDGITEAMNGKRQLFGEERFLKVIREGGHKKAEEFVDQLHSELLSFTEGTPQNDDITLVAIKEKTSVEKIELKRAQKAYELIQEGNSIKESCKTAGISVYTFNKKYRKKLENGELEISTVIEDTEPLEAKHLSIEEKTKIYDIISRHPEYGAKKISDELMTDRYGNTEISVARIYEELVRARLNTRELREAYVSRGGRKKKRIKPPGTPLLTIDGKVIIQKSDFEEEDIPIPEPPEEEITAGEEAVAAQEVPVAKEESRDILDIDVDELLTARPEDLFDKRGPGVAGGSGFKPEYVEEPMGGDTESFGESELRTVEEPAASFGDSSFDYVSDEEELEAEDQVGDETELAAEEEVLEESLLPESEPNIVPSQKENLADEETFEGLVVEGPSPLEELYPGGRRGAKEIDEFDEIPDWVDELTETEYVEDQPTTMEREDEEEIKDIDIDIPVDRRGKVDADEVDFSDFVLSGGGMDEPQPEVAPSTPFAEEEIEDAQVVFEEQSADELYDSQELLDPFEEFLQMEEEHGLVEASGEVAPGLSAEEPEEERTTEEPQAVESSIEEAEELAEEVTFEDLIDEIEHESGFQNPDEEFDTLLAQLTQPEQTGEHASFNGNGLVRAKNHYEAGEYKAAIELLQDLVKKEPKNAEVLILLGNALFKTRNYQGAALRYEQVIALDRTNTQALENLGIIYANRGNLDLAIQKWEKLLAVAPTRKDIKESINRAKRYLGQL